MPTAHRVRRAWILGGGAIAAMMLVVGTAQAVSQLAHEQETVVDVIDDPVRSLEVESGAGSVTVLGSERTDVRVTAEIDHGLRRTGHSVEVEGDRLVVRSSCPVFMSSFCSIHYTIEVPADLDVTISSPGRVEVANLTGRVDVDSDHGRIDADHLAGDVDLRADHSSITATNLSGPTVHADSDHGSVRLQFAEAPRTVTASTDHGDVEVVLPDDETEYLVDATTEQGATATSVRTDPTSSRSITADSDHGDVIVRYG